MASWIFAVLDDISMLMDDIASMTKIATKKTAGLLGDDIAVNAKQATGFPSSRELPVIWAIIKGSFINKLIIIPIVFIFSILAPWLVKSILLIWACYLAYEWTEKLFEWIFHYHSQWPKKKKHFSEKQKIKNAIITDFILSLEIVVIAFSTVLDQSWQIKLAVVSVVAFLATIWVYGLVALIVKIDDLWLWILQKSDGKWLLAWIGEKMVLSLPYIIKGLSIIWVIAMLLVAGGILTHSIHWLDNFSLIPKIFYEFILGIILWSLVILFFKLLKYIVKKF